MAKKRTGWQYRVVKRMRGLRGEWFDFGTAATFATERAARQYAETFAREQGAARVWGARITVRQRRGDATVATYYSDDYVAGRRRVTNPDGSPQLRWEPVSTSAPASTTETTPGTMRQGYAGYR